MNPQRVLLISSLSIKKNSSFAEQLKQLALGFKNRGVTVFTAGQTTQPYPKKDKPDKCDDRAASLQAYVTPDDAADLPLLDAEIMDKLLRIYRIDAVVLLGYPNLFPFLNTGKSFSAPLYLWAQFSAPPQYGIPDNVIPVPLTETTRIYLANAGATDLSPPIPHGVNTEIFHPVSMSDKIRERERIGFPTDYFIIGTVATNIYRKRLNILIEAFHRVRKRYKKTHLVIKTDRSVSPGAGYNLAALITNFRLQGSVTLIENWLPPDKMAKIYPILDLYIHVSEWEGFGIPVIEAMSCGVPVATHAVQGPGEIVPYSELLIYGSRIVNDGDVVLRWLEPNAVARSVMKAIEMDKTCLEKISLRGLAEIDDRYSLKVVVDRWLNCFAAIQGQNQGHSSI